MFTLRSSSSRRSSPQVVEQLQLKLQLPLPTRYGPPFLRSSLPCFLPPLLWAPHAGCPITDVHAQAPSSASSMHAPQAGTPVQHARSAQHAKSAQHTHLEAASILDGLVAGPLQNVQVEGLGQDMLGGAQEAHQALQKGAREARRGTGLRAFSAGPKALGTANKAAVTGACAYPFAG